MSDPNATPATLTPEQLERLQRNSFLPAGYSDACPECGALASDIRAALDTLTATRAKLAEAESRMAALEARP